MNFQTYLKSRTKRINNLLEKNLIFKNPAVQNLTSAIRYSVLNGGKRLRPLLVYAVGESFGAGLNKLDVAALAIEMVHASSLVHDDLPAMDNDVLRRGKPTCHIAFGEAMAILVGDALLVLAFSIINNNKNITSPLAMKLSQTLSQLSNICGMIGGQAMDIQPAKHQVSIVAIEKMYKLKTGALLQASVKMAAFTAGVVDSKVLHTLDKFAQTLGLAFQIQDDILDIEGSAEVIGKNVHSDKTKGKVTYPELVGLAEAKVKVAALWKKANSLLGKLPVDALLLREFISLLQERKH